MRFMLLAASIALVNCVDQVTHQKTYDIYDAVQHQGIVIPGLNPLFQYYQMYQDGTDVPMDTSHIQQWAPVNNKLGNLREIQEKYLGDDRLQDPRTGLPAVYPATYYFQNGKLFTSYLHPGAPITRFAIEKLKQHHDEQERNPLGTDDRIETIQKQLRDRDSQLIRPNLQYLHPQYAPPTYQPHQQQPQQQQRPIDPNFAPPNFAPPNFAPPTYQPHQQQPHQQQHQQQPHQQQQHQQQPHQRQQHQQQQQPIYPNYPPPTYQQPSHSSLGQLNPPLGQNPGQNLPPSPLGQLPLHSPPLEQNNLQPLPLEQVPNQTPHPDSGTSSGEPHNRQG